MLGIGLGLWQSSNASGGGSFNPSSLSPSLFFDATNLATIFQDTGGTTPVASAGQAVALVKDLSGNNNHLLQSTADNCAVFSSSGGLYGLDFDGTNDSYAFTSGVSPGSNYTLIHVFKRISSSNIVQLHGRASGSSSPEAQWWTDNVRYVSLGNTDNTYGSSASTGNFVWTCERVSGVDSLRVNGAAVGTTHSSSNAASPFTHMGVVSTYYSRMIWRSSIGFARAVTSQERAQLETWAGAKGGLSI